MWILSLVWILGVMTGGLAYGKWNLIDKLLITIAEIPENCFAIASVVLE